MTKNKYGAIRTNGFASKAEAKHIAELRLLERAGEIRNLEVQPKFPIIVNGVKVCTYIADAAYFTKNKRVVIDVKSPATAKNPVYRLKKKLVEALYPGVTITEVFR